MRHILKNHYLIDIVALILTFIFITTGILVSLHRYWQYETFYYNFGVFDQAIWHVSRFQPPIIEHLLVGGKWNLADHFDLSILLLAPVFWLTSKSEVLLIVQAIFAGLAGLVIYRIGLDVLKDKFLSLSIACCYFFFVGIQNAVITDFQELTIMTLPVTLTFLFIIRKQLKLFWLFFLLVLGFKEVTFLLGIGIAVFIFFYNKKWRIQAISAFIVSILWGYLAMKVFIPYFSGGIYLHMPDLAEGIMGKVNAMFDEPVKRQTLYYSFLQFGFLPVFSPDMWFAIIQDYVQRFLPKYTTTYWTLGLHYNAVVTTLLAIASIFGLSFLERIKRIKKYIYIIALILIINAFYQFRFTHHGPFLMAINPDFYKHTSDFKFLDNLIAKIPAGASVMTQNNLGVRFDHRKFIYLRENYETYSPDYILIDNRPGQNPNDFLFAPDISRLLTKIKHDSSYGIFYHNRDQYIFKKRISANK